MKEIKLMKTKAGNGFKIIVENEWYYTNNRDVQRFFDGEIPVVTFRKLHSEQNVGEREVQKIVNIP